MPEAERQARLMQILGEVKRLAAEFYTLTGKPLGVTGEVAEHAAAERLGLTLAAARETGFHAIRGSERIQIKGRVFNAPTDAGQRLGKLRLDIDCDAAVYVALEPKTP